MRRFVTCCSLLTIALLPAWAQQDVITTAIGGGPNDIPAVQANLNAPTGLALDAAGNYYFAAFSANRVYKVNTSGILTVVAGAGTAGYAGDGVVGGAPNALLSGPLGVAVDSAGNVYVADYNNYVIRKIDTTNTITTIAGVQGVCNYNGDGAPATSFHLCEPEGVATDTSGNLYIGDTGNCRVRKLVLATDTISTYAGTGTCGYNGDNILATTAELRNPVGLSLDNAGDLFIADYNNFRIREVASSNQFITTVAGNGTNGFTGDNNPAISAEIGYVGQGLEVNGAGTLVTFGDYSNYRVRQFTVGGDINTVAGKGTASFCGDGGPATDACIYGPRGLAITGSGTIYVADYSNERIRQFTVGGDIGTAAGNGSTTFPTLVSGVPPQGVVFNTVGDVLEDPSGNVFISDQKNCMVRELVKSTGLVNIFAGSAASGAVTGTCGFSGEGGAATSAELGTVGGIARDSSGNIYIADETNCVVWQVNTSNAISISVGVTPRDCAFGGDGGLATSAKLSGPNGVFVDNNNNLYIGDQNNNRVREVTSGTINTIAGNGTAGFLGDGDPATIAELNAPSGVTVDSAGNVYIADYNNCVIREVSAATGLISAIAGIPRSCGFDGDGLATAHELYFPNRVHLDANGNLFIADVDNERVRWVSPAGLMTTIAGNGTAGLAGDGGPAISAELNIPNGITQDASGDFLVADYNNGRIREVSAFAALNTSANNLDFGLVTVGSTATPQTLTLSALGPLTFSNISISGPFTESDDCGSGLSNAATCTMYVFFKPTAAGTETGAINIEDNGFFTDTATINLEGTGSAISVTGGPMVFGSEAVGSKSKAKKATVTNKGTASVTMGAITLDDTDFTISANTCPASGSALAAKAKCTISVEFKPKTNGQKKGALVINDSDPSSPQIVGMTGTGTSSVSLTPASVNFGDQAVGTTSTPPTKITLTNNTAASLTLKTPAVTVTAPFGLGTGATSCSNGQVIAVGGTCFIYVNFTPTSVGYPTGTVSVFDSDASSPQTVALSGAGTGVSFNPVSVSLSSTVGRQASTSASITNAGSSTITFTAATITGPNSADWSTNNGDPPCGGTLAPGALCSFTVYFTPSIVGSESATYYVYDSSTGSPQSLPLSGTGVSASQRR